MFYWLYNNVDVEQMKNILRYDVDYTWIGVMLVISTFSHVFRAMRWRLQLRALGIDPAQAVLVVIDPVARCQDDQRPLTSTGTHRRLTRWAESARDGCAEARRGRGVVPAPVDQLLGDLPQEA